MESEGIQATLTRLHQDSNQWEIEAFEGPKGYQPEMWTELDEVRKFSRELWELALENEGKSTH